MQVQEEQHGSFTVLTPSGLAGDGDADRLKDRVETWLGRADRSSGLVVDVSKVSSIDSRGLEVLVEISGLAVKTGISFKLAGANKTLRDVLALTDLASLFDHFEDVAAAVGSGP